MSSSANAMKLKIETPSGRGSGSTEVAVARGGKSVRAKGASPADTFVATVLRKLSGDQNLIYLAQRLQNYAASTDARLVSLRAAATRGDFAAVIDLAHALTDSTARLGAIPSMKLCIALQMLARRELGSRVVALVDELEREYERFKENLIWAVG
jgi:HPt (histidine-containing phosphotransfer) domain-containing protein